MIQKRRRTLEPGRLYSPAEFRRLSPPEEKLVDDRPAAVVQAEDGIKAAEEELRLAHIAWEKTGADVRRWEMELAARRGGDHDGFLRFSPSRKIPGELVGSLGECKRRVEVTWLLLEESNEKVRIARVRYTEVAKRWELEKRAKANSKMFAESERLRRKKMLGV